MKVKVVRALKVDQQTQLSSL